MLLVRGTGGEIIILARPVTDLRSFVYYCQEGCALNWLSFDVTDFPLALELVRSVFSRLVVVSTLPRAAPRMLKHICKDIRTTS